MITIYKYYLDPDKTHVRARNAHILEFLSVQVQHRDIVLWALVDTEKPANYADIYILGTGWNLGTKREPWLTKENFVDTVQDRDGYVWHIFGVIPQEELKKEKVRQREEYQTEREEAKNKLNEVAKILKDNNIGMMLCTASNSSKALKEAIDKLSKEQKPYGWEILFGDINGLEVMKINMDEIMKDFENAKEELSAKKTETEEKKEPSIWDIFNEQA